MEKKNNGVGQNKLNHEQQEFVIERLADFIPYPEILKEIWDNWGIKLAEQAIGYYKSTKKREISKKREDLNKYLDNIPIANKSIRLKRLNRRFDQLQGGSPRDVTKLELELIEQARKEREGIKVGLETRTGTAQAGEAIDTEDLQGMVDEYRRNREKGSQDTGEPEKVDE